MSGISVNIEYDRRKPDYIGEYRFLRSSDRIGYDRRKRIISVNVGRSVRIGYRRKPDRSVKIGFRLKLDYIGELVNVGSSVHSIAEDSFGENQIISVNVGRSVKIGFPTKTGLYRQIGECRFFSLLGRKRYVRRKTFYIGEYRWVGRYVWGTHKNRINR